MSDTHLHLPGALPTAVLPQPGVTDYRPVPDVPDVDCYASIAPATSKFGRWGKKHGNKPVILPFRKGRAYNAASALRDMELADPVYGHERADTPLFREAQGNAHP